MLPSLQAPEPEALRPSDPQARRRAMRVMVKKHSRFAMFFDSKAPHLPRHSWLLSSAVALADHLPGSRRRVCWAKRRGECSAASLSHECGGISLARSMPNAQCATTSSLRNKRSGPFGDIFVPISAIRTFKKYVMAATAPSFGVACSL